MLLLQQSAQRVPAFRDNRRRVLCSCSPAVGNARLCNNVHRVKVSSIRARPRSVVNSVGRPSINFRVSEQEDEYGETATASAVENANLVAVAVDATPASRMAVAWTVDQLLRPGDSVRLVHVLCDERLSSTAVGTTGTGRFSYQPFNSTASLDAEDNIRELDSRRHQAADDMVLKEMVPILVAAGISYEVSYPTYPGAKSAAVVGDIICQNALNSGAKMAVIASHGPGIMAEFGSVARYCYQHSRLPLVVLPPATLGADMEKEGWGQGGPVVVGVKDQRELDELLEWVQEKMLREGDCLEVLQIAPAGAKHLKLPKSYPVSANLRRIDIQAADRASHTAGAEAAAHDVEEWLGTFAAADAHNAAGIALVEAAGQLGARVLVVASDRGGDLQSELSQSSVASYATRHTTRPLLLV